MPSATIIVDADACPVKPEIVTAAEKFSAEVIMVASFDHRLQPSVNVKVVQVDRSDQSVDLYISNLLQKNNIMITQDYGLAAIGLAKKAIVLSNRGQEYTNDTIDFLLDRRHIQSKLRRSGKHTRGPKAFTDRDRSYFLHSLTKVLQRLQENESI